MAGIGKLDRRINFIQPIITIGDSNEDKITAYELIDSVSEVWASKSDSRGNTLVQADRVVYSQTVNWLIRYREDLNVRMRLVDQNNWQVYEIIGFEEHPGSRKRYMTVTTTLLDNEYWS